MPVALELLRQSGKLILGFRSVAVDALQVEAKITRGALRRNLRICAVVLENWDPKLLRDVIGPSIKAIDSIRVRCFQLSRFDVIVTHDITTIVAFAISSMLLALRTRTKGSKQRRRHIADTRFLRDGVKMQT